LEDDMVLQSAVKSLERQAWLDPVAEKVQGLVTSAYNAAGRRFQDLLYGVWLGHPLHPVLTDVAIGGWTTAFVLDAVEAATNRKDVGWYADVAVALGLAGGVSSALTGWNDWRWTMALERARRIGLGHAALNGTALTLYASSLLLRRSGSRTAGRCMSSASFGVVLLAAYLGGDLVYGEQIGVSHAQLQSPPTEWVPVLPEDQLRENKPTLAQTGSVPVMLVRSGGQIYALFDTCAHLGCSLAGGHLEDRSIVCPCHGSRFALEDGRVLNGPATFPEPRFETRVRDGQIEVHAPSSG